MKSLLVRYKKRIILFFIGAVLLTAGIYSYWNSYVKFIPTGFDGNDFCVVEENDLIVENLPAVLRYHGISFKVDKDGDICVKRYIADDRELIWNFTTKSMDSNWIANHQ
ncbi:hypothetical protein [Chitinophaga flava]|uniref:Uncharacterized protein n=1 Tax=Chitinophaga flava TaxID=2259036 RepID=A0A365XRA4_9BACT|nr:hypothetical protein [Chitinophaga flava]RBL88561.1 hypothetical protein DF182_18455 [Chitinophaga flava]